MELGYFLAPYHLPDADYTQSLQQDMASVVRLDELGWREAWIGEHFTALWEPIVSPELFIAMALAKTTNIILGTGVTCIPNHNPFHLAHRIAQLDHMAEGRFQWGVGPGVNALDFVAVGIDPSSGEHREMTKASIDMVLKIWEGAPPGVYETKWWRIEIGEPDLAHDLGVYIKPYQKPHPPMATAGVTVKSDTLVLAGERGWIPMSINVVAPWVLKTHWEAVEEGAGMAGRTPNRSEWRISREVFVADTTAEARKLALEGSIARDYDQHLLPFLADYDLMNLAKPDLELPDSAITSEFLVDHVWLVGSPEDVERKIRELYDEVGGFGLLMPMSHDWIPWEAWDRSMTLLAEEVMPRVSDLTG